MNIIFDYVNMWYNPKIADRLKTSKKQGAEKWQISFVFISKNPIQIQTRNWMMVLDIWFFFASVGALQIRLSSIY